VLSPRAIYAVAGLLGLSAAGAVAVTSARSVERGEGDFQGAPQPARTLAMNRFKATR
jgi:hypothetical protein